MIELDNAFSNPQGIVIRDADDAGAKFDVAGALRGDGDENFRRGTNLGSGRMMFAAPSFVIIAPIEPLNELEVLFQSQGRVKYQPYGTAQEKYQIASDGSSNYLSWRCVSRN